MPPPHSQTDRPKIFISYRRSENAADAARLFDRLESHFGPQSIFVDIESIAPGRNFVEVTADAISSCKVVLVLIGRHWLNYADDRGRRLEDPKDHVRREVATALKQGVRVIPVLVQDAVMPRDFELPDEIAELAHINAWTLTVRHWRQDVEKLIESIAEDVGGGGGKKFPRKALAAVAVLSLITAVSVYWAFGFKRRLELRPAESCAKPAEGEALYEAEDAALSNGPRMYRNPSGFSGHAFVGGYGVEAAPATGDKAPSTTFKVAAPSDGLYQVSLCYGNGHDSPRTMMIHVNEEFVTRTVLKNTPDRWEVWHAQAETLPLRAGSNTISYQKNAHGDGEVNLDFITVSPAPILPPSQKPTPMPKPAPPAPSPTRKPRRTLSAAEAERQRQRELFRILKLQSPEHPTP